MSSRRTTRTRILEAVHELISQHEAELSLGRIADLAGVSRQAIYLHFANKTELFIAAAQYTDELHGLEDHLAPLLQAKTPIDLLHRQARFLATYNPLIYPIVQAVDAMRRGDRDLEVSWLDRLANRRAGCHRIATQLSNWNALANGWTIAEAGDWLTGQASVKLWEELVIDLGWSNRRYIRVMTRAMSVLIRPS